MKLLLACVLAGIFSASVCGSTVSGRHFEVTDKAMGHKLVDSGYPTADFEIEFDVTYTQPGSVFDTIGLNGAPVGSWSLQVTATQQATLNIWDGRKWHQLLTRAKIAPGRKTNVRFQRKGATIQSWVDGAADATASLAQALSGRPVFVGDFKGDEQWGKSYNIHQAFIGALDVRWFGPPRAAPEPEPVASVPEVPARRITGRQTTVPAGSPGSLALDGGIKLDIPAQREAMTFTSASLPTERAPVAGLDAFGPTVGVQWHGEVNPRTFVPRITFPASAVGGRTQVVVFRKGEQWVDDTVTPDQFTALATRRQADGSISAIDPYAPPPAPGAPMLMFVAPPVPTFTTRYGLASYTNALNWKNEPELVRMVPSDDASERKPYYKLPEAELARVRSFPLKNVIILIHGHNEYEKGGYVRGDSAQPWVVAYKRDVWTLFWKTLKASAKDYLDTTAVYEFIYPSYRPVFAAEQGVESLGLSLAKAIADQTEIARAAEQDLSFNLFVVAHSMGGLVGRVGLNELPNATLRNTATRAAMLERWTERMITWGTPHHGSPLVTMRFLLTGGYDLEGSASVLPVSLLRQNNTCNLAINFFAALDTPGERALRWDNHRPLNLRQAGWASPRREVMAAGNVDDYAAEYGLDAGKWLYGQDLAQFNRRDRHRDKVTAFFGVTTKDLVAKASFWRIFRNTTASRLALSSDIQKGVFLTGWLYQNTDTVLSHPVNKGDGAVPVESMIGEGVLSRHRALGDVDHEEYYGAPDGSSFVAAAKAVATSGATLGELGFNGDKKGKTYPPSLDLVVPLPGGPPVGADAALLVTATLTWPGDIKPGVRIKEVQLVAVDPAKPLEPGRVIPANLTFKPTGEISGTVLAKDHPAKPLVPVVRVVFKDKTRLDSKPAAAADNTLAALQKTTQLGISFCGVAQASSNPNEVGIVSLPTSLTTWGALGNILAGVSGTARSFGKTLAEPKFTWNGPEFSFTYATGPLAKETQSRQGKTKSKAEHACTLTGRYDPTTRSLVNLVVKTESRSASDFTPDPAWKPRSRLEAEITGPPKASSSGVHHVQELTANRVALTGSSTSDAGTTVTVSFFRDGKTLQPTCRLTTAYSQEETGKPAVRTNSTRVLGPPTKGNAMATSALHPTFFAQTGN